MLPDLVTVAELAAFSQLEIAPGDLSAQIKVSTASGLVRDYLQQDITYSADDVVVLDPNTYAQVVLPELPVIGVSLVECLQGGVWETVDPKWYRVSLRAGTVSGIVGEGYTWPLDEGTWRITYTHGWQETPWGLKAVVLGVAGRDYASSIGIDQERIGGYNVSYSADGLTPIEESALDRYRVARVS